MYEKGGVCLFMVSAGGWRVMLCVGSFFRRGGEREESAFAASLQGSFEISSVSESTHAHTSTQPHNKATSVRQFDHHARRGNRRQSAPTVLHPRSYTHGAQPSYMRASCPWAVASRTSASTWSGTARRGPSVSRPSSFARTRRHTTAAVALRSCAARGAAARSAAGASSAVVSAACRAETAAKRAAAIWGGSAVSTSTGELPRVCSVKQLRAMPSVHVTNSRCASAAARAAREPARTSGVSSGSKSVMSRPTAACRARMAAAVSPRAAQQARAVCSCPSCSESASASSSGTACWRARIHSTVTLPSGARAVRVPGSCAS
eukprot:m.167686 g.167686  ORF g.167686 m.167686 type:complete len:319 (+) comp15253_c0_seq2:1854-2810(+)